MANKLRQWAGRHLLWALAAALVALCGLVYVGDWCVLMVRERAGGAHGSVVVESTDVLREKGSKLEYFDNPPQMVSCVHSLFPHEGQSACWWLRRHADVERSLN